MVTGHRIDERAVNDLLGRIVLVIAHHASFDRRFLEKRLPTFVTKHWACSRADIDWKAEGIRSSALEFVAYALGFFHEGHRAASDCRATLHALAQRLPGTGRLALQALLVQARLPTWRLWARDAAIEKKDVLKARGYQDPSCGVRRTSDRPDPVYRIHVSDRLLEIHEGPFLELGLKGIAGTLIDRPRRREDRPDRDRLAIRFEQFKERRRLL